MRSPNGITPRVQRASEVDDILDRLPTGLALHAPDDFLEIWFPPGVVADVMEEQARERAERYAATCGCTFSYLAYLGEGRFYKGPRDHVALRWSASQFD